MMSAEKENRPQSGERYDPGRGCSPETTLERVLTTGGLLASRLQTCLDRLSGFNERLDGSGPDLASATLRKLEPGLAGRLESFIAELDRTTSGVEAQIEVLSHFL
jgi:hypothetical protein